MGENLEVIGLRSEIDRVDEEILSLIERRLELADRMAGAKATVSQHSPLRPDREEFILDKLKGKTKRATASLIEIVWRELIGQCRQLQGELGLVLGIGRDAKLLEECARRQFGSAIPVKRVASPDLALGLAWCSPAIAVIEEPVQSTELDLVDEVRALDGTVLGYAYARIKHEANR